MKIVFRFLLRYARQNVPSYALGLVMLFITNYAVVRIPTLIGDALTALQTTGPAAVAAGQDLALELAIWAVIVVFARTLSRVLFFNPGRLVEFRVGVDLFRHLLSLQRPFYMRRKVGELVSVATNDTSAARLLVGFAGLQVCNVAVALPLHVRQMWATDPVLTIWCMVPVAIGGIYMRHTVRQFYGMVRDSQEYLARLSDRILESYAGIGTTRAHVGEAAVIERFDERNVAYLDLQLRIAKVRSFAMPVLAFTGYVGAGLVLWVGGDRIMQGHMEIGELATFTTLLMSLVALLMSLAWVLAAVSRGVVSLGRIDAVMRTGDELPPADAPLEIAAPPTLELRDLSFTYAGDDKPALSAISATVAPGRTLGIFGRTGAGKTTLINLLARVYTPPPGSVQLNGHDVVAIPLADLRRRMAVVPQDPFLFSTTLRDNIRLRGEYRGHSPDDDRSGAYAKLTQEDDPQLAQVLEEACLREDIRNLPKGLDTVVGERGVMLSGGQRQRAALARALYRRPALLLLDDVLSAVDQGTEARLVAAIRGLTEHAVGGAQAPTTVIVSHRTSVLEHADEILVLEGGRVTERGTHQQLIARGGAYAETHKHQGVEGG